MSEDNPNETPDHASLRALGVRGGIGGVLMGLANLVPGISGGTMLLAAGVYPRFIQAIGEVTTFKFKRASLVTLASIVVPAALAFIVLAGPVKDLVIGYRWVMYSVFIGLTLGGVPLVWRLIQEPSVCESPSNDSPNDRPHGMYATWIGALAGFIAMAGIAVVQSTGASGDIERSGIVFLFLAGVAGASAMILPGVSGGYLLLVLGVYVPILTGVSTFKDALPVLGEFDLDTILNLGLNLVLPVGVGAIIGVVGVSNLLRWLLQRYEKATLGILLGLLVGAVVGLWPFQQSVEPVEGQVIKGQTITYGNYKTTEQATQATGWHYASTHQPVEAEDLPTEFFRPTGTQLAGSLGLVLLGLGATIMIDRLQGSRKT